MTYDRLVDLTAKLHQTSRLSISEALEFAHLVGKGDTDLDALAFRLLRQTFSLENTEEFSVACRLLFGCAFTGRVK